MLALLFVFLCVSSLCDSCHDIHVMNGFLCLFIFIIDSINDVHSSKRLLICYINSINNVWVPVNMPALLAHPFHRLWVRVGGLASPAQQLLADQTSRNRYMRAVAVRR